MNFYAVGTVIDLVIACASAAAAAPLIYRRSHLVWWREGVFGTATVAAMMTWAAFLPLPDRNPAEFAAYLCQAAWLVALRIWCHQDIDWNRDPDAEAEASLTHESLPPT